MAPVNRCNREDVQHRQTRKKESQSSEAFLTQLTNVFTLRIQSIFNVDTFKGCDLGAVEEITDNSLICEK